MSGSRTRRARTAGSAVIERVARGLCAIWIACGDRPPPPPPPSPCAPPEPFHAGEATHYDADGTGKCSFDHIRRADLPGEPLLVAAINTADYAEAARCGSCLVVVGPDDTEIVVEIVDRCPGCKPGDLDLSRDAFALLAPLDRGRIPIRWLPVPCHVERPLGYHWKPGASRAWAGIQIRHHRYPIAGVDLRDELGAFVALPRTDYNYFIGRGLGAGPFTLRVTDARGQTHVEHGVPLGREHTGSAQLPRCP